MTPHTVPRDTVTCAVAAELGRRAAIRPFHAIALMRIPRAEAITLCAEAVREHPTDLEARGYYVRARAVRPPVRKGTSTSFDLKGE